MPNPIAILAIVFVAFPAAVYLWLWLDLRQNERRRRAREPLLYVCRCCLEPQAIAPGGICGACLEVRMMGDRGMDAALEECTVEMCATAPEWIPEGWHCIHKGSTFILIPSPPEDSK